MKVGEQEKMGRFLVKRVSETEIIVCHEKKMENGGLIRRTGRGEMPGFKVDVTIYWPANFVSKEAVIESAIVETGADAMRFIRDTLIREKRY